MLKGKPLVMRDEIHGDMSFDTLLRNVIDHECFQRLRYIKQLGLAEYVFPCATHTRFQHSLGASYLAGQYFQSMVESWLTSPFRYEGKVGETTFFAARTYSVIQLVASHPPSYGFWHRIVSLGGMLHDVGHGPWSHSFENLNLKQDFNSVIDKMDGSLRAYFDGVRKEGRRFWHEEISVIYIFQLFTELAARGIVADAKLHYLPVSLLVNKTMMGPAIVKEVEDILAKNGIKGGVDFHRLLRPMISGPFDVDRIDYIQRDARNTGVHIGGIEWPRIVTKLVPCLAEHNSSQHEPRDVVLVSNIKNQHVLDDFIFSLFQMYAQVYMHPKIVGIEESIRKILEKGVPKGSDFTVTFDVHKALSDEKFREMLQSDFLLTAIDDLLFRRKGANIRVASFPTEADLDDVLTARNFTPLQTQDRPMMKDSVGVFLFTTFKEPQEFGTADYVIKPWVAVSPIAKQFYSIHHAPQFWIRPGA
jgi:HD superfamily phosphohydrolase